MVDMFLLKFSGQDLSYFEHQRHDLKLRFNKKYSLNSKYQTFDYKAFIDKFLETDSKVFQ